MRIARVLAALFITFAITFAAIAQPQPPPAPPSPTGRIDLIGAEIFGIDRSHSFLGFTVPFMGLTKVRGTFNDFIATILYDDVHPERSSMTVGIDATTIDTDNEGRDKDLQGDAWFATAKNPKILFRSTRVEPKGANKYIVHGELTMKGVTRAIAIPMTRTIARMPDAGWGNIRIGGTGSFTISRHDYGIDGPEFWSKALGDEITIDLDILGNRPNYDRRGFQSNEKPSIGEVLLKTVESSGGAAAAKQLRELREQKPNDYNFGPGQVSLVVQRLIQHRKVEDALPLLLAAVELYPDESGFQARLGEAYAMLNDRPNAIRAYEKAKAINPNHTEALEMLRALTR
jgi:polyisoprenoid-binding protein YceI